MRCGEVNQVSMVIKDLELVPCPFQQMSPLLKASDDGEELFVMDWVIPFHFTESLAVEADRMPFIVSAQLRQNGTCGIV